MHYIIVYPSTAFLETIGLLEKYIDQTFDQFDNQSASARLATYKLSWDNGSSIKPAASRSNIEPTYVL
ncbi:hypothetical protein [Pontibacillus yanchengensis]|nr:hypothetical protein [Pontibacillus yanchengensis]